MKVKTLSSLLVMGGVLFAGAIILMEAEHRIGPVAILDDTGRQSVTRVYAELPPLGSGEALVTAAFGLQALQPETYDRKLVDDILHASPLDGDIIQSLKYDLTQAETGALALPDVLADVRGALNVD